MYRPGKTPDHHKALGSVGAVHAAFDAVFIGLEWESPAEAVLPTYGGFRLELDEKHGSVQDVYTHGGLNHIKQFAEVCKREGWRLGDTEEGEDVDLDDPQRWYEQRAHRAST